MFVTQHQPQVGSRISSEIVQEVEYEAETYSNLRRKVATENLVLATATNRYYTHR